MNLKEVIYSLGQNQAILHYNVSTWEQLKAGILAIRETNIPLIIGLSEGERNYWYDDLIVTRIIKSYQKEIPIFVNADHCKSLETAKKAIDFDYDSVLFDGTELTLANNIDNIKALIDYGKGKNILIEGEVGYLPGKSDFQTEVEVKEDFLTKVEDAIYFYEQTKVDLLAISIGNFHGVSNVEPKLDLKRAKIIYDEIKVPLVLHGGSGIDSNILKMSASYGFKIIHLNTEFRKIWKEILKKELDSSSLVPYKILSPVVEALKERIIFYQKLLIS
ncbi:MAG: class II fructose-bisphosphate aldolase [Patescibacteria group bacterium]|nr:class II fructose-bisphosphate aldolase [Patescibacteria group bacterium]